MSEIDWSEAPEGAQYARKHTDGLDWYKRENGKWLYLSSSGAWDKAYGTSEADCEKRPPWSGDGLPPVGTVCEVMGKREGCEWVECCIVAHDGDLAVYRTQDGRYDADMALFENNPQRRLFRPIRTPEQIAAEERKAFISEIAALLGWDEKFDGAQRDAGKLYDAGYRKQEPKP